MASVIQGCILTARGFVDGTLEYVGGRVQRVLGEPIADERAKARTIILPGFIDTHVHGGGAIRWRAAMLIIARRPARHHVAALRPCGTAESNSQ
jgi:N-acetylglucosamine-6-phosphate deacetylase